MEPLRSDEVDCESIHDAVQKGHCSCLQHLCAATTGCKLNPNTDDHTPLDLIEHRSDGSCTALLQLLISNSTTEEIEDAVGHALGWDRDRSLLIACTSTRGSEKHTCCSCLCVLLDTAAGDRESDWATFTNELLFEAFR